MAIDTGRVTDRRKLHFNTIADLRRDLDALEAGYRNGTLRTTGNWTPGQIFTHVAAFLNYAYDGYPAQVQPPWFIKPLIRMMKNKYLNGGFPAGVKIPRIPEGTIGMENISFEEGIAKMRAAFARLEKSEPPIESPAFGRLSYDDKIKMNLRHAELHLSFLHPA